MTLECAKQKLQQYGQEHLLKYFDTLSETQKEALLQQIEETDFSVLNKIGSNEEESSTGTITPIRALRLPEIHANEDKYRETGLSAIRSGKVGAVLLAGGMGTRLGSDNPKGMYDIGVTKPMYIFERLIYNLMDVVRESGEFIHLFVMTSDKNHTATTTFFKEQNFFGYKEDYIHFFKQDMAPAATYDGKIFLEEPYKLATSPNGNGGWFSSMVNAGLLSDIKERGIEWINVFAVDNCLQRIADPMFVGATIAYGCESGAKVVRKAAPDERVGVLCTEDGKPSIAEYYEMTEEMATARKENGDLKYGFGVILNYLFSEKKLEQIADARMPIHVVEKKIPYMDVDGTFVKPEQPNGYKFETLVLDMVHMMDDCIPYEVVREREFAPIKNLHGVDSLDSARELMKGCGIEL